MSKHVIFATDLLPQWVPSPLRYFIGYRDDGANFEPAWTLDPWKASWIDAGEVEVELALLANSCPDAALEAWPLEAIDAAKTKQRLG